MSTFKLHLLRESKWVEVGTVQAKSRRYASAQLRGFPKKEDKITSIEFEGESVEHGCWRLTPA